MEDGRLRGKLLNTQPRLKGKGLEIVAKAAVASEAPKPERYLQRDSGKVFSVLEIVAREGRDELVRLTDGDGLTVNKSRGALNAALAEENGAWSRYETPGESPDVDS